jgi:hypothetical protein
MTQDDEHDAVVQRAYEEYWRAKEVLAALETACAEISTSSSITTEEGYLMYSPSGVRLLETDYVKEQVAQYHAARKHKEVLRKRLIDLGQPDPE